MLENNLKQELLKAYNNVSKAWMLLKAEKKVSALQGAFEIKASAALNVPLFR